MKRMILKIEDLTRIRQNHPKQKIVLTSGTFDLFHTGHLEYLHKVKRYGDLVIVLLSGDARVAARKGDKRPIIPEVDRAMILDSLKIVDHVLIDPSRMSPHETDPVHKEILDKLCPDYYVTDGPDPRFVDLMEKERFVIVERSVSQTSTTAIIERILERYR